MSPCSGELWPVYVASKGRAGKARLWPELMPTVLVEPQEAAAYRDAHPEATLHILSENDRGLAYVRQAAQDREAEAGGWYWMLDDDVTGFYRVQAGKCRPTGAREALVGAQRLVERAGPDTAQLGLEYQQFAWSNARGYVLNSYCDVCVAIHAGHARLARFRPQTGLKVDRDFTLQLLALGYRTVRATRWAFAAPENGSNAGGLSPDYATAGREAADVAAMCGLWPGLVRIQRKTNGRVDCKIDWRVLRV